MTNQTANNIEDLAEKSRQIRITALQMIGRVSSGHPGPTLSCADILATLYFSTLRVRADDPHWADRDRFILSKGHGAPSLYAALGMAGFYPKDFLLTFRKIGGGLQGHPDIKTTPGLEMTTGSLGNGLSVGVGMALAGRITRRDYRVYVLLGDGECQEGQVWEAAMAASTRRLNHLIAIVDRNGLQQTGSTEKTAALEPLDKKWEACNWQARKVNGHNFTELLNAFSWAQQSTDKPSVIIAQTVKGKGVSFMEGKPEWHAKTLTPEFLTQALAELEKGEAS